MVEEAPSPFVTPKMRKAMGEQCVALARAVGYYSAGTVELIVSGADPSGESFYFLEMNTRLQVEHPVTEAITGVDLVEQMIRVAAGEKLAMTQDDIGIDGWAIENRVYAEDPYRGFLPSTGRLVRYDPPAAKFHQAPFAESSARVVRQAHHERGGEADQTSSVRPEPVEGRAPSQAYIRVDDGVAEGGEVSMFYDPMIAKLVTWAPTRDEAADLQVEALDAFRIEGLGHNVDFLSAIMQHPRFRAGELTTGFIAEEYPEGFHGASGERGNAARASPPLPRESSFPPARAPTRPAARSTARAGPSSDWVVQMDGTDLRGHARRRSRDGRWPPGRRALRLDARRGDRDAPPQAMRKFGLIVRRDGVRWAITTHGATHRALVLPASIAPLAAHMIEKVPPDLSKFLICPMPGLLVTLHVAQGDNGRARPAAGDGRGDEDGKHPARGEGRNGCCPSRVGRGQPGSRPGHPRTRIRAVRRKRT